MRQTTSSTSTSIDDPRVERLIQQIMYTPDFDAETAWADVHSTTIESQRSHRLMPFEVLKFARAWLHELLFTRKGYRDPRAGFRPFREVTLMAEDADELAGRGAEDESEMEVHTELEEFLKPGLQVQPPDEMTARLRRVIDRATSGRSRLNSYEKEGLRILGASLTQATSRAELNKLIDQTTHIAKQFGQAPIVPWAKVRVAKLLVRAMAAERRNLVPKREGKLPATEEMLSLGHDAVRLLLDTNGALSYSSAAGSRGLYSSCANLLLRVRADLPSLRGDVQRGLERHRAHLLANYLRLGDDRLHDRIGLCTILSIPPGQRSRQFAWEAIELLVLYLAAHDVDLDEWSARSFPRAYDRVKQVLENVLHRAKALRQMIQASGRDLISASQTVDESLATVLRGLAISVGQDCLKSPSWPDINYWPRKPGYLLRWQTEYAERAAANVTTPVDQQCDALLVLAYVREFQARERDLLAVLDELEQRLPDQVVTEPPELTLLRWRVDQMRGLAWRRLGVPAKAQAAFQRAAMVAAEMGHLEAMNISIMSRALVFQQQRLHVRYHEDTRVVRLVVGLTLSVGRPSGVLLLGGVFPRSHVTPTAWSKEAGSLQARAWDVRFRNRRQRDSRGHEQKVHESQCRLILQWVAVAPSAGAPLISAAETISAARQHGVVSPLLYQMVERDLLPLAEQTGAPAATVTEIRSAMLAAVPILDLASLLSRASHSISTAPPMLLSKVITSVATLAWHHSRARQIDQVVSARLKRLATKAAGVYEEFAREILRRDGTSTQFANQLGEMRARYGGVSETVSARRRQFEDQLSRLREITRYSGVLLRDVMRLELSFASATPAPSKVPPAALVRDLIDIKHWARVNPATLKVIEFVDSDEADLPGQEDELGDTVDSLTLADGSNEHPILADAALEAVIRPAVLLDWFVSPHSGDANWDAFCVASIVRLQDDRIALEPRTVFEVPKSVLAADGAVGMASEKIGALSSNLATALQRISRGDTAAGEAAETAGAELGRRLFPDALLKWLDAIRPSTVYLCPHGPLVGVPLHALPTSGGSYFCDLPFDCATVPRAALLQPVPAAAADLNDAHGLGLVVDQGAPELWSDAVRELLAGQVHFAEFADVDGLLNGIRRQNGAMFFCHGLYVPDNLQGGRTRLFLSEGARLTLARLLRECPHQTLAGAELVLIACRAGSQRRRGDAGLAAAFLAAGARSVVAPLVPISPETGAKFAAAYAAVRQMEPVEVAFEAGVNALRKDSATSWGQWASFFLWRRLPTEAAQATERSVA